MVDEESTDGTVEKLTALGVPLAHSGGAKGVTHNWNLVRPTLIPECIELSHNRICDFSCCFDLQHHGYVNVLRKQPNREKPPSNDQELIGICRHISTGKLATQMRCFSSTTMC